MGNTKNNKVDILNQVQDDLIIWVAELLVTFEDTKSNKKIK